MLGISPQIYTIISRRTWHSDFDCNILLIENDNFMIHKILPMISVEFSVNIFYFLLDENKIILIVITVRFT